MKTKIDRTGWLLLVAGVALILMAAIIGSVETARGDAPRQSAHVVHRPALPWWMTRPCPTEDSLNCFWNAQEQGNGHGKSFYIRKMPHTGKRHPLVCIFYVNRVEAHISDQCWRYDGGGI
jgi:hypothetical protein